MQDYLNPLAPTGKRQLELASAFRYVDLLTGSAIEFDIRRLLKL